MQNLNVALNDEEMIVTICDIYRNCKHIQTSMSTNKGNPIYWKCLLLLIMLNEWLRDFSFSPIMKNKQIKIGYLK